MIIKKKLAIVVTIPSLVCQGRGGTFHHELPRDCIVIAMKHKVKPRVLILRKGRRECSA
jgi:hypothetical protein